MFSRKDALDIDLSSLGLPSGRDNSLAALKKRSEASHGAASGATPTHAGGATQSGAQAVPGRPAAPQRGALGSALDDLANVGRPSGGSSAASRPPSGVSADLDSLLHDLSGLAPPNGPRVPPQPPSRSTPAPRSGEALHTPAGGSSAVVDDYFGGQSVRAGPPPLASPITRTGSHASVSSSGAADDLDSFFAGGSGATTGAVGLQSTSLPAEQMPPRHPPSPPHSTRSSHGHRDVAAAGEASAPPPPVDDFFSGSAFNEAAAAAAAKLTRRPSDYDNDDFFSGGAKGGAAQHAAHNSRDVMDDWMSGDKHSGGRATPPPGAAAAAPAQPASPSQDARPRHTRVPSGGGSNEQQPAVHGDSADPFDMFTSPQRPQYAAGGKRPGGGGGGGGSHHTPASSISSLDDLASFVETTKRTGMASSSDPLHDVVFGSPQKPSKPGGFAAHVHTKAQAPAASATAGAHVNEADVAAAMCGTDMAKQQQREEEEACAADPNEPEERKIARRRRHEEARSRVEAAVREKLARDAVAAAQAEERHVVSDAMGPKLDAWVKKGKGNIRLYLATVQDVLWEGNTWKPISLPDLVAPLQVKKAWMKVLVNIHPDKVQQRGGTTTQRFVADKVFHVMLDAYNAFASKEL